MNMLNLCKFLVVTLFATVLFSCDNDDDFRYYHSNVNVAYGIIVNASPNSGDLFFFADENQVNSTALNYTDARGYFNFFIGDRVLSLQDDAGTELVTTDVTLADNDIFSAFAVNTFDNLELVVYDDDLVRPSSGFSHVRFINLSPDAEPINVADTDGTLTENLAFKDASNFIEVSSGTYNFQFTDSGSGDVLFEDTSVELFSGRIYTIYTKGYVTPPDGSNDTFSTEIYRNL